MRTALKSALLIEVFISFIPVTLLWYINFSATINILFKAVTDFTYLQGLPLHNYLIFSVLGGVGLLGLFSVVWAIKEGTSFYFSNKTTLIYVALGCLAIAYELFSIWPKYSLMTIILLLPLICITHLLIIFRKVYI